MLKKILIAVAAAIAVLAVVIATRPDHYQVARSVTVAAGPSSTSRPVSSQRQR